MVGTPQFKYKKVRAEQNWAEQKLCEPVEQKSVEYKLVGTFGIWVVLTPQFKCKKFRAEQKWVEQKWCDPAEQKLVE